MSPEQFHQAAQKLASKAVGCTYLATEIYMYGVHITKEREYRLSMAFTPSEKAKSFAPHVISNSHIYTSITVNATFPKQALDHAKDWLIAWEYLPAPRKRAKSRTTANELPLTPKSAENTEKQPEKHPNQTAGLVLPPPQETPQAGNG